MKIIIASNNQGKIKEFRELLEPLGLEVETLADYPELPEVEETGTTFQENAILKAQTISDQLQALALADDSGLVVSILGGAPGIYSARYAGEPKDDRRNNDKLLKELANYQGDDRKAHFVSSIAVTYPDREPLVVEGQVKGQILEAPQGEDGFGYDPLFYYEPFGKSFAQVDLADKNRVSHRAQATEKLLKVLPDWLERIES